MSDTTMNTGRVSRQIAPFGDGVERYLEASPDGSLYISSLKQKLTLAGRMCVVNVGTITTPVTFLITATRRPDWVIRVLAGTAIIPFKVETVLESAAGTVTEIDIRQCANDLGDATSSAASIGPLSTFFNGTTGKYTVATVARQLYTADAAVEVTPVSLHRTTFPSALNVAAPTYTDTWYPNGEESIIVGPGSLEGFVAATTTQATGYVQIYYAEVPAAWALG